MINAVATPRAGACLRALCEAEPPVLSGIETETDRKGAMALVKGDGTRQSKERSIAQDAACDALSVACFLRDEARVAFGMWTACAGAGWYRDVCTDGKKPGDHATFRLSAMSQTTYACQGSGADGSVARKVLAGQP